MHKIVDSALSPHVEAKSVMSDTDNIKDQDQRFVLSANIHSKGKQFF